MRKKFGAQRPSIECRKLSINKGLPTYGDGRGWAERPAVPAPTMTVSNFMTYPSALTSLLLINSVPGACSGPAVTHDAHSPEQKMGHS